MMNPNDLQKNDCKWDLSLLLRADPDSFPDQPEIVLEKFVEEDSRFGRSYVESQLKEFWDKLVPLVERVVEQKGQASEVNQEAIRWYSQLSIYLNRIDSYVALYHNREFTDETENLADTVEEFCTAQTNRLNKLKHKLQEVGLLEEIYSPERDYREDHNWNYEQHTDAVSKIDRTYTEAYTEVEIDIPGSEPMALDDAEAEMSHSGAEKRRLIWTKRNDVLCGEPFKRDFLVLLQDAKALQRQLENHQIDRKASIPTDERGGFSHEEEAKWKDALGWGAASDTSSDDSYAGLMQQFVELKASLRGDKILHFADYRGPIDEKVTLPPMDIFQVRDSLASMFTEWGCGRGGFIHDYFLPSGTLDTTRKPSDASYAYTHQSLYTTAFISFPPAGNISDVPYLGHELGGHTIHYEECNSQKPPQIPSLIRDEFVAAVTELYATKKMLEQAKALDASQRIEILNYTLRDFFWTIVEKAGVHEMETFIQHAPLMPPKDKLEEKWKSISGQVFGGKFDHESYVQKFYDDPYFFTPYYKHQYSKDMCLAMAVIEKYGEKPAELGCKMAELMQQPGNKPLSASMMDVFGIDTKEPDTWKAGTRWMGEQLNELKCLVKEVGKNKTQAASEQLLKRENEDIRSRQIPLLIY